MFYFKVLPNHSPGIIEETCENPQPGFDVHLMNRSQNCYHLSQLAWQEKRACFHQLCILDVSLKKKT
jgi:hypothetical protein